jgi:hypothetical protein
VLPSDCTLDWIHRSEESRLGDRFAVRIGSVVDYRDRHEGGEHPFIHSRDLPRWGTLSRISRTRRFAGRLVEPPFVAVRRTSRPGDAHRAIGTLVLGESPVAVENHVICLIRTAADNAAAGRPCETYETLSQPAGLTRASAAAT